MWGARFGGKPSLFITEILNTILLSISSAFFSSHYSVRVLSSQSLTIVPH